MPNMKRLERRWRRPDLYRAMRPAEGGRPSLGRSARSLGIRPQTDIPVVEGMVSPLSGGMSVSLGDPRYLPEHRRPLSLGGTGKDPVYRLKARQVPKALAVRSDADLEGHAFLEPAHVMPIETYEESIASSQRRWRRILDP